jgi:predicted RND superfamily exporter protein
MSRPLDRVSRRIVENRWALLAFIGVCTVVFGLSALRLDVNNDHSTWLPRHDKTAQLLLQVDKEFSSNVMVFTVIDFSDKGVFDPSSLALIRDITRALDGMEELFNVTSIANIIDIRKTEDGIEVGDLMTEIPETPEEMEAFRRYVLAEEMYVNAIVSADGAYTALMTNIDSRYDEVKIFEKISGVVRGIAGDRVHFFGGDPAVHFYMNEYMNRDMTVLVPIMLAVMVFILWFGLRRVTGVIFPLTLVGLSIIWTFGLMSFFDYPINILSPPVAVLLLALGSDYAVHFYNHYLKKGDAASSASEIAVPIVMSALTTIAGLLTFATTRIDVLKNFGIEMAFGLGSACFLSVVLLAIGLHIFKIRASSPQEEEQGGHVFSRAMALLGGWVHDHARAILAASVAGLVIMGFGILKMRTNVDFIGQLPADSPPRQGCTILMDHFNGMYPFNLYFRGDLEDPAVMNRMSYLENYLRSEGIVGGITSINALIAEENWLLNGIYAIPETREGIANLWFMLEGQEILKTFVKPDRKQGLVNSVVRESSTSEMRFLAGRLEEFMDREVSGRIVQVDPGSLMPEGRAALEKVRLGEASGQLGWLARFYGRVKDTDSALLEDRLARALTDPGTDTGLSPVLEEARTYLEEETVEVLPGPLIEGLLAVVGKNRAPERLSAAGRVMEEMIVQSGAMDAQDARITVEGLLKRIGFARRIQRTASLGAALSDLFPRSLSADEDFRKRSEGVLWDLLADRPFFFFRQVENVPGIESAILADTDVPIDQAGMPETIRVVHRLLISSQFQSLALAALIVLILVSLTQRSFKRGAISLLSILIPLEFILGFMGWKGIPLDLGTVLCGALVIGLGIDGSIHFLHYFHKLGKEGIHGKDAIQMTMGHVGRAVLTANATTFSGFVVLLFSQTTAVRNFSTVNSLAILLVTVSILTILPALITLMHVGEGRGASHGDAAWETSPVPSDRPAAPGSFRSANRAGRTPCRMKRTSREDLPQSS